MGPRPVAGTSIVPGRLVSPFDLGAFSRPADISGITDKACWKATYSIGTFSGWYPTVLGAIRQSCTASQL